MAEATVQSFEETTPGRGAARPDFQVVPLKGLPIVAVVFAALIVAIAVNERWPLIFLHVAFGAAWTIIDLFLGFVIGPILGRMSVPARIELTTKLMPKMVLIMPVVVTVTLAAGWQLGQLMGTVDSSYYLVVLTLSLVVYAVHVPVLIAFTVARYD